MASFEEDKAALASVNDLLGNEVVGAIRGAKDRLDEARALLVRIVETTTNENAWEAIGHLDRVSAEMEEQTGSIGRTMLLVEQVSASL